MVKEPEVTSGEWEKLIRKIVQEEIKAYMERVRQTRGWEEVKPWPPYEIKEKKG